MEITKKFIATRDDTETISSIFVELWPLNTNLTKNDGEWHSEKNGQRIERLPMESFKKLYGFLPNKGEKVVVLVIVDG